MQANAAHGAYPNRAGHHRAKLAQRILQFQEPAHNLLAGGVQNLPGGGRFNSGPSAFYQSAVVLFLQAADLLADSRLSYEILRGGIRKASTFNYVAENLERFDV